MPEAESYHMPVAEFRRRGKEVIDWIADYHEQVEHYPVLAQVQPGDISASLAPSAPVKGEAFSALLQDLEDKILPGITHWQSPHFHGYFPANISGPAILGELLSAGLGVQGMLWSTSPACTELETRVLDWLAQLLGLPDKYYSSGSGGGVLQDSASSAILCALLAARERASGQRSNQQGCDGKQVAYCSTQAHSAMEKAMGIVGLGRAKLRQVEVDETFAMDAAHLAALIKADKAKGLRPVFVCATLGTTSSNALDPVAAIGRHCAAEGLWLHLDAAMSGAAAICPEHRYLHDGIDYTDSYCFNPHKWIFTNFDCSCLWVADRQALIKAMSIQPEYLLNKASASGVVFDYRDWQVPLGRRFRALKLWFVLRYYGVEGLQYHIRRHIALTRQLRAWIQADAHFELVAPTPLNLICFRRRGSDELSKKLMDTLNNSGRIFLTHTRLNGRFVIRICIGQAHTELRHVEQAWRLIQGVAEELCAGEKDASPAASE